MAKRRKSSRGRAAAESEGATRFDLDLFLQLNKEYKGKPVRETVRQADRKSRGLHAQERAAMLEERMGVRGMRVLEVGCWRGDLPAVLARDYECEVVGVDVQEYSAWKEFDHPNLSLRVLDIGLEHDLEPESFDCIVSLVAWEHVQHPYSTLKACKDLLKPRGRFYLRANLYRGPLASHRYRDVYFPWPHLLFTDEVFEQFYRHEGMRPRRPSWVNKLTYPHYLLFFEMTGFSIEQEWLASRPLDEKFYKRFEDVLSRYPILDLTTDFFDVLLTKPDVALPTPAVSGTLGYGGSERDLAQRRQRAADLLKLIEQERDELTETRWQLREELATRQAMEGQVVALQERIAACEGQIQENAETIAAQVEQIREYEAESSALKRELSQIDAATDDVAASLPSWVAPADTTALGLRRAASVLKRRPYRLAWRLSQRPRDLKYWLTLPLDIVRIAMRRDGGSHTA
ncbi:MAG: class I SAM-dependent methyltransferase [Planctomycetota bacterium]|jgi:SAM-dependent methyltransferase